MFRAPKRAGFALALLLLPAAARGQDEIELGPDPAETQLALHLEEILREPVLDDAVVGVHVRSLEDGRTLFARNATKLFNPASNVKILTTAAALWHLGSNYRFRTVAYRNAPISGGVLQGNLYIKGRGDPTLTSEQLFGFVNEIALAGITRIDGNIVVDDGFFDEVYEGPGWEQERGDRSYAPPVSALSVNYGTFSIRVMPGDRVGAPARVALWPDVPMLEISDAVYTRGRGSRSRIFVGTSKGPGGGLLVSVRGNVALDEVEGATSYQRVNHPTLYAGQVIERMLQLRGIEVKGAVRPGVTPGAGVAPLATHFSVPLAQIVSTLNKYSNNFIAEQILKTMGAELKDAPGTWDKGCEAIKDFLSEIGIAPSSVVVGNGSGLNDINRVTPEQLTRVLEVMHTRFEIAPEFIASLAVAGVSGTITSRFSDGPAKERLRAKTGSLQGVSALSGYVMTKDKRVLAFSVMMNDYAGRARAMWRVQDAIGTALAEFEGAAVIAQP